MSIRPVVRGSLRIVLRQLLLPSVIKNLGSSQSSSASRSAASTRMYDMYKDTTRAALACNLLRPGHAGKRERNYYLRLPPVPFRPAFQHMSGI